MVRDLAATLRRCGWRLALADLTVKLLVLAVATPLTGLALRGFLVASGRDALADADIFFFALTPVGMVCFAVVGALVCGALVWELLALTVVLWADESGVALRSSDAVRLCLPRCGAAISLAARLLGGAVLRLLPFAAAAALVAWTLLSRYDVNYYLAERPPEFVAAVMVGVVLAAAAVRRVGRWASARAFSLPLLLTEHLTPGEALARSCVETAGREREIVLWLAGWLGAAAAAAGLLTSALLALCRWAADSLTSMALVALAAGILLVVHAALQTFANLAGNVVLATLLWQLFARRPRAAFVGEASAPGPFARHARRLASWSLRRKFAASAVLLVASTALGALSLAGVEVDDGPVVTAHRGGGAAAPENTLAAIRLAMEAGTDWIEVDVQESADGEVVVMHDSDFQRIGGSPLKVWEATLAEMRGIDVGSHRDARFAGERIATLDEVLQLSRGRVKVNIELKDYGHNQRLEERVAALVEKHDMAGRVAVMSLERSLLDRFQRLRPTWRTGLLTAVAVGDLTRVEVDFLAVRDALATAAFVQQAHRRGKEVAAWTLNDRASMMRMLSRGVDNLITDRPDLARAVLRERAELSLMQRWLVGFAAAVGR